MSFRQKTALVSLIALGLMYGWYFAQFGLHGWHLPYIVSITYFVIALVGVIAIQIVGTLLILLLSNERQQPMDERERGIAAALAWYRAADAAVVYTDRGISRGMELGIATAKAAGKPVEFRSLGQTHLG